MTDQPSESGGLEGPAAPPSSEPAGEGARSTPSRLRLSAPVETGANAGTVATSWACRSSMVTTPRSVPRAAARSAAMIQSARADPGAVTFWPSAVTRLLGEGGRRQQQVGRAGRSGEVGVHRDDDARAGQPPPRQAGIGEVGQRIGAQQ